MAYFAPRYNCWFQVWRYNAGAAAHVLLGYTRGQLRGPDSHWEGSVAESLALFQVLFPKGTDIRDRGVSGLSFPDAIVPAGFGRRVIEVVAVCQKGSGFVNEYVLCLCRYYQVTNQPPPFFPGGPQFGQGRVNVNLLPPDGFPAVPIIEPAADWAL